MVSIQDWSKWNRLYGDANISNISIDKKKSKSRQHRKSNRPLLSGVGEDFFTSVDSDFLLNTFAEPINDKQIVEMKSRYKTTNEKDENTRRLLKKQIDTISCVTLDRSHLNCIGILSYCRNLQILVLSNNHLTSIDSLIYCKCLRLLDLSGNNISMLPGISFWNSLKFLRYLLLHDNQVSKRNSIYGLSGCHCLSVLTLSDSPLSLRENYRHHVVNNIVTLKCLDSYVISDEEIIEGANFGGTKFVKFHPGFRLLPLKTIQKFTKFEDAEITMRQHSSSVTAILRHHSPVIIIQRYLRGWLSRRLINKVDLAINRTLVPPPPSRKSEKQHSIETFKTHLSPTTDISDANITTSDKTNINYDNYVKENYHMDVPSTIENETIALSGNEQVTTSEVPVHLDVHQLEKGGTTLLSLDAISAELDYFSNSDVDRQRQPLNSPITALRGPTGFMKESLNAENNVPQFGSVMTSPVEMDAFLDTNYRLGLSGASKSIVLRNAFEEMVLSRAEAGKMVKDAEADFHLQRAMSLAAVKAVSEPVQKNNNDYLLRQGQITMGTLGLQRWARLETDMALEKLALQKAEKIIHDHMERDAAKASINVWRSEKRRDAQVKNSHFHRLTERAQQSREKADRVQRHIAAEKIRAQRMFKQKVRNDRAFSTNFGAQQSSISSALKKHDFKTIKESHYSANFAQVQNEKTDSHERHADIRRYLEEERQKRQTEIAVQRAAIDAQLLSDANERLLGAYSRVSHLKNLRRAVMELGAASAPVPDHPDRLTAEHFEGVDHWNAQVLVQDGRVGLHPSS